MPSQEPLHPGVAHGTKEASYAFSTGVLSWAAGVVMIYGEVVAAARAFADGAEAVLGGEKLPVVFFGKIVFLELASPLFLRVDPFGAAGLALADVPPCRTHPGHVRHVPIGLPLLAGEAL
jgi:hypothetical protein